MDRFKFRWFDKTIDFMAKVKSLNIEDDYAIVEYSFAESETPDEEVKLSTGVLMQCTERRDTKGILIYGGDRINNGEEIFEVYFCDSVLQWRAKNKKGVSSLWAILKDYSTEVIGNIYT